MKYSSIILVGLSSAAWAAPVLNTESGVDKVVHLSVPQKSVTASNNSALLALSAKRSSPAAEPLANQVMYYTATVNIGTPSQSIQTLLDTDSSDLWVYGAGSGASSTFNPTGSSTYRYLNNDFQFNMYRERQLVTGLLTLLMSEVIC
jgi:hypothetical protein